MAHNRTYTGGKHSVGTPTIGKEGYFQMIRKIKNVKDDRQRIKHMSYDERLRNYEREKDELFSKINRMSSAEVAEAHRALVEKWGV